MQSNFGKIFRFNREGIFLLSLLVITLIYQIIKPNTPFQLAVASLIFFLIVPFAVARFILRENIYFLGFRKGRLGQGMGGILLGWIIFLPILNLLADQQEFRLSYLPFQSMRESVSGLLFLEIAVFLPVFLGVQTFIFGYAYEGLSRMIGKSKTMLALCFVGLPLFYLERPLVEIVLASFAGLVACWIRNRSRSTLYPVVFGWGLSVILDALIVYKNFIS